MPDALSARPLREVRQDLRLVEADGPLLVVLGDMDVHDRDTASEQLVDGFDVGLGVGAAAPFARHLMKLVKAFLDSGKPVAAICHAPWLLIQADAVRGLALTSYTSIRKDVENAGGKWVDKEVVVDKGIVTSRSPDDLKAFVPKIIEEVREGRHQQRKAA
jgi:putative intracellular protease/amidase